MIRSMTGYGAAQCVENGLSHTLEIRSLNNRYLKLAIKLPEAMQFAEPAVEKILRGGIARGSVTCTLRVRSESGATTPPINQAVLQSYVDQIAAVRVPADVRATLDLGCLAVLPGVCDPPPPDEAEQAKTLATVEQLTQQALAALDAMRLQEGRALRDNLFTAVAEMRRRLATIAERAPCVVEEYQGRLRLRVAGLLRSAELELESDGLMREVALFAERCDVAEELTRLASHLDQFTELCDRGEEVGRTLDFLAQELLREANTIASKSNDATIARQIVEVKGVIDRMKEQVQNVE